MSNAEKHVCVACEQAGKPSVVNLDAHGKCPQCGGDSVVSELVLLSYAAKQLEAKAKPVVIRETSPLDVDARMSALRSKIEENAAGVRALLLRNHLLDLNLWWTGQRYWLEWSFFTKNYPSNECEYVDLILGNANAERRLRMYIDLNDDAMHEVL